MKNTSLELYRVFREAARAGNMTRAAERLYVTQPNVSLALKALEKQLDATLFIRTKKGIRLTREGEVLFEELDRAFECIEAAERKLDRLLNLDGGTISISASDTICSYYLLPHIRDFTLRHPQVRLEITNRTSFETAELLKSGKADLGFVNLPMEDASLEIRPCLGTTEVLVAGPKYASLAEVPFPLSSLADYPLIMLERKSNSRLHLDRFLAERGIASEPVLELGSIDLIVSFVRNDLGLAFIPGELCGRHIDGRTLYRIPAAEPLPKGAVGAASLRDTPLPHAAKSFLDFVIEKTGSER